MTQPACKLKEFWRVSNTGPLVGKATIEFPGGWIVAGIPVFRRQNGTFSAGAPDVPIIDSDGKHCVDDRGKKRYAKIITFANDAAQQRWERLVIDCVTGEVE